MSELTILPTSPYLFPDHSRRLEVIALADADAGAVAVTCTCSERATNTAPKLSCVSTSAIFLPISPHTSVTRDLALCLAIRKLALTG